MRTRHTTIGRVALVAVLVALPAAAGQGNAKGGDRVKGHVIKVEHQEQTRNDGADTHLWVRNRNGETLRLRLGNGDGCNGCVEVGDRVQLRLGKQQGSGGAWSVQSMKVRRSGEMFALHNDGSGNLVRQRSRFGEGGGAGLKNGGSGGQRVQTRLQDGSNCNDSGRRSGQGGVNAGRGSRGGGGGGGGGRG